MQASTFKVGEMLAAATLVSVVVVVSLGDSEIGSDGSCFAK